MTLGIKLNFKNDYDLNPMKTSNASKKICFTHLHQNKKKDLKMKNDDTNKLDIFSHCTHS
jgi:hypothetical protein